MSEQTASIDITRYTIISKIGEGSFSKVYRVKDVKTSKSYAAKISKFMIDEDTKESEEARLLFREVNLMSLLNHPSVLRFVGYYPTNFDGDPLPTIITELAMNGSLSDIISLESRGLSPDEWTSTKKLINIYGIASGILYLHSHNILHRDLKPENILLDNYLHPKISDFGLSKITDFLSASMNFQSRKGMKGTPAYMAPEIMRDEEYSKSGDVYAFGFIVYELMTCKEPFPNFDIYKLMRRVMNEGYRPSIDEDVPQSYRKLIEKCWLQEADDRPTFNEIVEELKTNQEFITESVDELEYLDYVEFIDKYVCTFEVDKRTIHFADFIKQQGRNKNVKPILFNETFLGTQNNDDLNSNQFEDNNKPTEYEFSKAKKIDDEKSKEITKSSLTSINENQQKIDENEMIPIKISETESNEPTKIKETNITSGSGMIYPLDEFNNLSQNNQKLVEEAMIDAEKQFLVGQFLIEGKNDFPNNITIGVKYMEQSIAQKCINAVVYYGKLLIRGKIIQEDEKKVQEILNILNTSDDPRKYLIQGLMSYKKNQYSESVRFYQEGAKLGDLDCMYQYGKMLFVGEGIKKNNNESIKYFKKSKERGYEKSANFLKSFEELNKLKVFQELQSETQLILIRNNNKQQERQESQFNKITLHPKDTEKLFFNKSLISDTFHECLKLYNDITIEVGYPSDAFNPIIDLIVKLRTKNIPQLKIGVIFTSLVIPLSKKCFSKEISYHQIESSIQTIPDKAFKNCTSMTKIIIPSSVTDIGNDAFIGIKTLEISGSIQIIYYHMFSSCSSLKQIIISSPVTQIGHYAFSDCSSLKKITIPSSVTRIGDSAFENCISLKEITIPSSVTLIGNSAFNSCTSLKVITIPSSVTQIGNSAFNYCPLLKVITIPSSVIQIGDYAFSNCSSLKQITIPSSVTKIGGGVFNGCIKLDQIIIQSDGEPKFAFYERKLFICKSDSNSKTFDTVISFTSNTQKIIIPKSIKKIERSAFSGSSSLKEITIPSSVTQIGESAFYGCSSLKEITIPSSVTQIGELAFSDCTSLKKITIPLSITQIGDWAFSTCPSLKEITVPSSLNTDKIVGLGSNIKINKI